MSEGSQNDELTKRAVAYIASVRKECSKSPPLTLGERLNVIEQRLRAIENAFAGDVRCSCDRDSHCFDGPHAAWCTIND